MWSIPQPFSKSPKSKTNYGNVGYTASDKYPRWRYYITVTSQFIRIGTTAPLHFVAKLYINHVVHISGTVVW